jgi:DNA polymerase-3 subunit epsilon
MDIKRVFIDTETTGLDGETNGIHQISGMIEINGKVVDDFNYFVRPFEEDFITSDALKTSHVTRDMILSYPEPKEIHADLVKKLGKHCNKYKKWDKYFLMAYNGPFDHQHLRAWFKKNEDNYFGSWFFVPDFCVMRYALAMLQNERAKLENFKLSTVAEYLGIAEKDDPRYHDAKFDVEVTRKMYHLIEERVTWKVC